MAAQAVSTTDDVLAVYPEEYKQADATPPVQQAVVGAQLEMHLQWQSDADYAAAQSNIASAAGRYLDGLVEDRGLARSATEQDEFLRARALAVPKIVTPLAILEAVNAILSSYTSAQSQYLESVIDRAYLRLVPPNDPEPPPQNYAAVLDTTPVSPMRLYPEDLAINGAARVQCSPGGMWLFGDEVGRYFVLRVPDLSALDDQIPVVYGPSAKPPAIAVGRMFLGNSLVASPSFLYDNTSTAIDVYTSVASAVTAIVGHSIRWKMVSDPSLQ